VNVQGTIEYTSFNFDVASTTDLYAACVAFAQSHRFEHNDDATVVVDYGQLQTLRNGLSYWSAEETCGEIVNAARSSGRLDDNSQWMVIGKIEQYPYTFSGWSRQDIGKQCYDFAANLSFVDDITVSINFGRKIILRNGSSYWRTKYEICEQILDLLGDHF